MPYVQRTAQGSIFSITQVADDTHQEYLAPTSPEIVSFLTTSQEIHSAKATLSESDQAFTRVTEDLINLLIEKNIILFTELPTAVQAKMTGREKLRSNLNDKPFNFLDDGDSI